MLGSNLDIMSPEWTNVIFKDRNQAYGAYQLRKNNARNTNMALLIALSIFVFALATPTIINWIRHFVPEAAVTYTTREVTNDLIRIEKPKVIPPAPQKQVQAQHNMIRSFPPVATADGHETPPTNEQLEKADPGPQTITGTAGAGPALDEKVGTQAIAGPAENTNPNEVFPTSEIQPSFPGGEAAFGKFLSDHIRYPAVAKENGVQGRVFVQFIVERDGSLTDMKIVRDPGSGLGDETTRVLKLSPHWKPGMQNGKPVRVQFTIPVNYSLAD